MAQSPELGFADSYKAGTPIVPQIEAWAKANKIELNAPGWEVEVAKRTKQALLGKTAKPIAPEYMKIWETLLATLLK